MRKLEELSLTDFWMAGLYTKIQEWSIYLALISSGKISRFFDHAFDWASARHFRIFYGSDIRQLLSKLPYLEKNTQNTVLDRVVIPFFTRNEKISASVKRKVAGKKTSQTDLNLSIAILTYAVLKDVPVSDVVDRVAGAISRYNEKSDKPTF